MIVWLWDSPPAAQGVSDDDGRARHSGGSHAQFRRGNGRVERARLALGYEWMTLGYLRSGYGWSAERHGDGIRWVALTAPDLVTT